MFPTTIEVNTYENVTMKSTSGNIFTAKIVNSIMNAFVDLECSTSNEDIVNCLLELPEMKVTTQRLYHEN